MYASADAITERYGPESLHIVTDPEGVVDMQAVDRALLDASAYIDSFLQSQYDVPLAHVPAVIVRYCVDVALYWMAENGGGVSEERRQRFDDATKWLERVSDGKAALTLPDDDSDSDDGEEPSLDDGVVIHSDERLFTRTQLGRF